jgi:precorrin-3B synthase
VPTRTREIDACPGVLTVHPAADGGVARIRVPGGRLSAAAFRAVASSARDLGDGGIELTSRANLQLRGLAPGAPLGSRLRAAGLLPSASHDLVRNIVASPLTGRAGPGLASVAPLVSGLDEALRADSSLAALPGRFLFAVDDGRGDVAWLGADVSAVLVSPSTAAVLLGGVDCGLRAGLAEVTDLMLACAAAFLTERDGEWRMAELPAAALERVATRAGGGTPGDDRELPPEPSISVGPLGAVSQHDGRVALVAGAPLGFLDADQASALGEAAAELVITPWRSVVVPDLERTEPTATRLRDAGLLLDPGAPRVTACVGRPGCAKALADVRADAKPVDDTGGLPVHWSGCTRRCGRPRGDVVDVVATGDGYTVTRGHR